MIKKIFKIILTLTIFITLSFIFDMVLHFFTKAGMARILVSHGAIYFAYGGISLISSFTFDSVRTYTSLHNKKSVIPLPKKANNLDVFYSVAGGFSLIALEVFYH